MKNQKILRISRQLVTYWSVHIDHSPSDNISILIRQGVIVVLNSIRLCLSISQENSVWFLIPFTEFYLIIYIFSCSQIICEELEGFSVFVV